MLPRLLVTLNRLDEQDLRMLSRDRMAEYLLQRYHFPQVYRNLLLSDLRKVEPKTIMHFSQEMTRFKLLREEHVPLHLHKRQIEE